MKCPLWLCILPYLLILTSLHNSSTVLRASGACLKWRSAQDGPWTRGMATSVWHAELSHHHHHVCFVVHSSTRHTSLGEAMTSMTLLLLIKTREIFSKEAERVPSSSPPVRVLSYHSQDVLSARGLRLAP